MTQYSPHSPNLSAVPIFVAYPYSFDKADYRGAFEGVAEEYGVQFTYADERITNKQILDKIVEMIEEADFSIFDVTTWNPNVALELGVAIGAELDYYILFNSKIAEGDVPSDLGGLDRIQYTSYNELAEGVGRLLRQQFGAPIRERSEQAKSRGAEVVSALEEMSAEVPDIVRADPGLRIGGIASALGVPVDYAKNLVQPLVGEQLRTEGVKRGTRYFAMDDEPDQSSGETGD
jgi:hypothetical protein